MAVTLFEIAPGAPLVFHCDRLHASLSPKACAVNYNFCFNLACHNCPTGAAHTAEAPAPRPPEKKPETNFAAVPTWDEASPANAYHSKHHYPLRFQPVGALACVRCGEQAWRRIGPGLCVSCLNRTAEAVKGRNAKGHRPIEVSARLFRIRALLTGDFSCANEWRIKFRSQCSPVVTRISGGAFVDGVFSGRPEFDRWLAQFYPGAELIDFEQVGSLAQIAGYATPNRGGRVHLQTS